jgi:hypothetical protein
VNFFKIKTDMAGYTKDKSEEIIRDAEEKTGKLKQKKRLRYI